MKIPTVHRSIYKFANLGSRYISISSDLGEREADLDQFTEETLMSIIESVTQEESNI